MSGDWVDKLCNQVDKSPDFEALARIMPHIGIDVEEIQCLMKQKIKELDSETARRAVFNVSPIQSIIPMDAIQHILSYQHFSSLKNVSNTFKKCFDRNQDIAKRLRPRIVDDYAHLFAPEISYDESVNKTYGIGFETLQTLKEISTSFGNIIPFIGTLQQCKDTVYRSGDRILLQNGDYKIRDVDLYFEDDICQIIGIGEAVNITFYGCSMDIVGESKLLLRNVNVWFEMAHNVPSISVDHQARLWMDKCDLRAKHCVYIYEEGTAHFKSCTFTGSEIALSVEGDHEKYTNVLGCTFLSNRSCIETEQPIRCIGNIFINNGGTTSIINEKKTSFELFAKSTFEGNVFEGENEEFEWLRHAKSPS